MNNKTEKTFKLDDILLTSFLLTQKISLLDVVEENPHHFVFVLSNPEKCTSLKQEYLNGASAPARELFLKRELLMGEIKAKSNYPSKGGNRYE